MTIVKTKRRITQLDRPTVRMLADVIQKAVQDALDKYDLGVHEKGCTFDHTSATYKVVISTKTPDGEIITPEAQAFKSFAGMYGLKANDLGKRFRSPTGETYQITGLSTRRCKFPIFGKRIRDGRGFKFPAATVVNGLKGKF